MFEFLEVWREEYGTAQLVVLGALLVGALFGVIAEISRYCLRAAVAEQASGSSGSDKPRSLQVLSAALVALAGTQLLHFAGLIDLSQSMHWTVGLNPVALIVGGALFGIGMVLAGGCVSRLLVLAASGNMRSMVTLLIIGLTGYATVRGLLSYPRIWLENAWATEFSASQMLTVGSNLYLVVALVAALLVAAFVAVWKSSQGRGGYAAVLTGGLVGGFVVSAWFVTGVVGADDFEPTPLTALSFVAPVGETVQYFMIFTGDTIRFSIALVLGVIGGAFVSALIGGRSRLVGFAKERDVLRYALGGVLMGFGGVTALGCTVGQGLSGVSTASPASMIAITSIVLAAYATIKLQARGVQGMAHGVVPAE